MTWYISTPQGNRGPFDDAKMKDLITQKLIHGQTWVWQQGYENWVQLASTGAFDLNQTSAPDQPTAHEVAPSHSLISGSDDEMDAIFIAQVRRSWDRHRAREHATEVDEVLVGGVITGVLDNGYSLIDLESDGSNHYLRFEDTDSGNRVIFQLNHMAESLIVSEVIGHEAMVTVGYGERVKNTGKIMTALKQEFKGGYIAKADPGIITIDADLSSQYIYCMVELIWDISDYLDPDNPYKVIYPKLASDLGASINALRKYLRGRFQS